MLDALSWLLGVGSQIAVIVAWLGAGGLLGLGLIAAACFSPWFKRELVCAAILAFAATWILARGVYLEKQVCDARFVEAQRRFAKLQADVAAQAEADRARLAGELSVHEAEIDRGNQRYAELLKKSKNAPCLATDDDVRELRD